MQIPLYRNVVISMIVCLFFSTTSSSFILISIAFNCASIDTCTFVDGCTFTSTMFSSHAFIYIAYASIDYFSITSSSNSWMNTRYTDVVLGPICSFVCQLFLLLMHKNSTIDGPILYIVNYCLCKLHLLIVHFAFFTFWRWWWMRWRPYNQRLNIQHSITLYSLQLLFNFSFLTLLLPPLVYVYAHSYVLPFPLLLSIVSWSYSSHSCLCELKTLKTPTTFDSYLVFFRPWASHSSHSFFYLAAIF